ncbi:hypothetical protein MRB53_014914 [Persea americana]|uniref:Uncharacterized protein n=1 Tax=Persea americana TaxID=3435 RepID=A0ACC2KC55_PERAE|nr:hypothetical protein MRB53_014914 [Persea americana]
MARSSNSLSSPTYPPFTWVHFFASKGVVEEKSPLSVPEGSDPNLNSCTQKCLQEDSCNAKGSLLQEYPQENSRLEGYPEENLFEKDVVFTTREFFGDKSEFSRKKRLSSLVVEGKVLSKVRKRPARIVIPEAYEVLGFDEVERDLGEKEFQVQGRSFSLVSKKGGRKVMEDGYSVITDISGDSRQAFFGVFDGHGGRAAVDHVTNKLGNNILRAIEKIGKEEDKLEQAIKAGYLTTDEEFLSQGQSSGACVATVLLKDAELHVANAGDCRVVLSRSGTAIALTSDHRVVREDERLRIESKGGYVHCRNGIWRVQGSLAVSRAMGDVHLKEWVISEPETNKLPLTSDCEFLIVASDGLWDKVTNQEAVDVVLRHKNSIESCKMLAEISSSRGNKDDITVMVVDLQNFR